MNKRSRTGTMRAQAQKASRQDLDLATSTTPFNEIPKYVQFTSPAVSTSAVTTNGGPLTATTLPLNLIALIVSYLDDVGDLARVTRTSRLLYYMTLPQLYQRVHLHSYADIQYTNGKPDGFGGGSPFLAALGGLASKGHAALVQDFRVHGMWKETGVEDFAKGRVPDNSMMLNILLRSVTDKMVKLKSFSWELDCKPLKTLYSGLATHSTLTSFTLKFPSARIPRPSVLIPPMANLRVFKATDIDPMCYPDDISMLMLHSKKLVDVRLHFSPRMRQEAESIMTLAQFFGRCYKAGYRLRVKHFAIQNFFGPNVLGMEHVFEEDVCESIVFFDTFGGSDPRTIFVDETWRAVPPDLKTNFKRMRVNEISPEHIEILTRAKQTLECLYLVSAKQPRTGFTPASSGTPTTTPSVPSADTPHTPDPDLEAISLRQRSLQTINTFHGSSLKHLLLRDCWPLSGNEIADLVHHCPNLEQLGLAVHGVHHDGVRLFLPFLQHLKALRLLSNEHLVEHLRVVSHEERMDAIGRDLGKAFNTTARIFGVGDTVYKVGGLIEDINENGLLEWRREVTFGTREDALKWDIWRLDCLDISADPIAT